MSTDTRAELQAALDQAVASVQEPAQLLAWLRGQKGMLWRSSVRFGSSCAAEHEILVYLNRWGRRHRIIISLISHPVKPTRMAASTRDTVMTTACPPWFADVAAAAHRTSSCRHPRTRAELIATVERIAAEYAEATR